MRNLRVLTVLAICVLGLMATLSAEANKYGVADKYQIKFENPIRVGGTLLPAGNYTILHTMEGTDHIMVFRGEGKKAVEVKAKCALVPLTEKASLTQKIFVVNNANERELRELIFRGDTAKHVF